LEETAATQATSGKGEKHISRWRRRRRQASNVCAPTWGWGLSPASSASPTRAPEATGRQCVLGLRKAHGAAHAVTR
jgi:hypothetical protein